MHSTSYGLDAQRCFALFPTFREADGATSMWVLLQDIRSHATHIVPHSLFFCIGCGVHFLHFSLAELLSSADNFHRTFCDNLTRLFLRAHRCFRNWNVASFFHSIAENRHFEPQWPVNRRPPPGKRGMIAWMYVPFTLTRPGNLASQKLSFFSSSTTQSASIGRNVCIRIGSIDCPVP